MSFGGQTITFVSFTDSGTPGALGTYTQVETTTSVTGCRHRPLAFEETAEYDVDIATELWRTTIPVGEYSPELRAVVLAVKANDEIRVDGVSYKIIGGIRHHVDMAGNPFKATIISQRQTG
jgi:hypothetical protein